MNKKSQNIEIRRGVVSISTSHKREKAPETDKLAMGDLLNE
jgi:hypothetical protein